jgi:YVTN family beta-propeller protein
VTSAENNTLTVIDTATNAIVATVPVGRGPRGVAVSPDERRVYVALFGFGTAIPGGVAVIDATTNTVITTIR